MTHAVTNDCIGGYCLDCEEEAFDNQTLADLLSLVMDNPPTEGTVAGWSDAQREAADRWAAAEHLSASDNPVMRFCAPHFLGIDQHVKPHRGCILR